jgi:hypothetical protein
VKRVLGRAPTGVFVLRAGAPLVLAALLLALLPSSAAALRCGVERWNVKTAVDSDVGRIDATKTTATTITALLQLAKPASRPDDARVDPTETTVFSLTARLTRFKWENSSRSGDSDYHLVIEDESGNSMVAEIPDPACVGPSSPVRSRIMQARQQFNARFSATGSFKSVDPPISVRVTGIGFFDKPDHASGSASNGIELHPVLDLVFDPGLEAAGAGARELLGNSSFEDGTAAPWQVSAGVVTNSTDRKTETGAYYAWLGGYGRTHTDTLAQTVTVPADAQKVTLTFGIAIDTAEPTTTDRYDEMRVEIQDTSGAILQGLIVYSNLDATSGYEKRNFVLTRFKGQTITLAFTAEEDSSLETSWLLDDLTITVE